MVILKFLGLLLIVLALMALGFDGMHSLEVGQIEIRSLAQISTLLVPDYYQGFVNWSSATFSSGVLSARDTILAFPSWAVLGVLGIVIAGFVRLVNR